MACCPVCDSEFYPGAEKPSIVLRGVPSMLVTLALSAMADIICIDCSTLLFVRGLQASPKAAPISVPIAIEQIVPVATITGTVEDTVPVPPIEEPVIKPEHASVAAKELAAETTVAVAMAPFIPRPSRSQAVTQMLRLLGIRKPEAARCMSATDAIELGLRLKATSEAFGVVANGGGRKALDVFLSATWTIGFGEGRLADIVLTPDDAGALSRTCFGFHLEAGKIAAWLMPRNESNVVQLRDLSRPKRVGGKIRKERGPNATNVPPVVIVKGGKKINEKKKDRQ